MMNAGRRMPAGLHFSFSSLYSCNRSGCDLSKLTEIRLKAAWFTAALSESETAIFRLATEDGRYR
jgi:hypothetical protein